MGFSCGPLNFRFIKQFNYSKAIIASVFCEIASALVPDLCKMKHVLLFLMKSRDDQTLDTANPFSNSVKLDVRSFILHLSCQILNYRITLDAVLTLTPLELGVGISQH